VGGVWNVMGMRMLRLENFKITQHGLQKFNILIARIEFINTKIIEITIWILSIKQKEKFE
jgi:hypothetical protein